MDVTLYCTKCSLTLSTPVDQDRELGYCPKCGTKNRIPDPDEQYLGESGLMVPRTSAANWYFGPEPSHQRLAFENAKAHLDLMLELIQQREDLQREAEQRLQTSVKTASIPSPDDVTSEHTELLQNAYTCVRLSQFGGSSVAAIRKHIEQICELLARRDKARRFTKRFFNRSFAEVELEIVSRELTEICTGDATKKLINQNTEETNKVLPPSDLPELLGDYLFQLSDYVAVVEAHTPKLDFPETEQPASHGGLPEEIALAVEAVQLSVQDLRLTLRGYQEFGIKYLVKQQRTVLGDEMGLGKTIQALGAMVHLQATESADRFLVVAPASVIYNWQHEILNRTQLPCHILHGKNRHANVDIWNKEGGIGVTSFSTLWSLDLDFTQTLDFLVVDEAHKVKNQAAERSQLTEQFAKCSKRVCLMTGTPLENHVSEFVNLIRICNTDVADQLKSDALSQGEGSQPVASAFRDEIAPVYLRRNQIDVLTELPEAIEIEEWIDLNAADRKHYDDVKQRWNIQDRRQAANGSSVSSSKMQRLAELIEDYREQGRKVIVFSNFIKTLEMAAGIVGEHFSIRGSVPAKKRQTICDQFNKADGFQVLIGPIEACGVGVNLQAASAVILMEPQFKPTSEWQAIARAQRMGQTRTVNVHRLLATNTVDENLSKLVREKAQSFDDYARESSVKEFSSDAVDTSEVELRHQLLKMEP